MRGTADSNIQQRQLAVADFFKKNHFHTDINSDVLILVNESEWQFDCSANGRDIYKKNVLMRENLMDVNPSTIESKFRPVVEFEANTLNVIDFYVLRQQGHSPASMFDYTKAHIDAIFAEFINNNSEIHNVH